MTFLWKKAVVSKSCSPRDCSLFHCEVDIDMTSYGKSPAQIKVAGSYESRTRKPLPLPTLTKDTHAHHFRIWTDLFLVKSYIPPQHQAPAHHLSQAFTFRTEKNHFVSCLFLLDNGIRKSFCRLHFSQSYFHKDSFAVNESVMFQGK